MTTYYGMYDSTGSLSHAGNVDETIIDVPTFFTNLAAQPVNAGLTVYSQTSGPFDILTSYITGVGSTPTLTARPALTDICQWNKTIAVDAGNNTTSMSANGTDSLTCNAIPTTGSALPNPTAVTLTIPGGLGIDSYQTATITDGSFSMNVPASGAGTYVITLNSFPYQTYTLTVVAS